MTRIIDLLWRAGWIILFELRLLRSVKRATPEIRARRLETCRACPIFVKRFSRCGFIHATDNQTGQTVILGCGCWMKIKSSVADSTCFARDNDLLIGWPDEINGTGDE